MARRSKPIGVGIIGCGGIARYKHILELAPVKELSLVGCSDLIRKRARDIAKLGGAAFYTNDNAELLARDDVEAVIVATPHPSHVDLAIEVLRAGKHLLVQKPMATTVKDANRLLAAARRRPKQVALSLPYMYTPWCMKIEQLITGGKIGPVRMARCRLGHDADHGKHVWFAQKQAAHGGAMFDMGVYGVALLVQWMGRVTQVSAMFPDSTNGVDVEQGAAVTLRFASGAVGVLETSWQEIGHRHQATVYGTEATLDGQQCYSGPAALSIAVKSKRPGHRATFKPVALPKRIAMPQNVCQHWADCIIKGTAPLMSIERSRHLIEILCGAYASARTGKHIRIRSTP